jgi:hypothetical protein
MSSFADNIRPHVDAELLAAGSDPQNGFAHLERAHVLGQASTREHVRVHWHMMRWAWRHRDAREFAGHTGGSNVSAVKPMPVDPELAAIIEKAQVERTKDGASR